MMRSSKYILAILLVLTIPTYGCNISTQNVQGKYENYDGITFVSPAGYPPPTDLVWSPYDRDQILVSTSGIGIGPSELYILDLVSKDRQILAETTYGRFSAIAWLDDGGKVVVNVAADTKEFDQGGLYIFNLVDNTSSFINRLGTPALSRDEKTLAILTSIRTPGEKRKGFNLHVVDMDTNREELVLSDETIPRLFGLSWSADGRHLALSLGDFDNSDLYVFDVQSRQLIPLSTDNDTNIYPSWSPQNNIIAYKESYFQNDVYRENLHLIDSDGHCDITVPNIDFVLSPTWSPDGSQLAFVGPDGIYIIDLEKYLGRDINQGLCFS